MTETRADRARPLLRVWTDLPLFWKLQIGGWLTHAVVTFPAKMLGFASLQPALVATLVLEPLGFLLSCGLRAAYRRLGLRVERPMTLTFWVGIGSAAAAATDWLVSTCVQTWMLFPLATPVIIVGLSWFRGAQYVAWSCLYFWIRNVLASRERAISLIQAEAAARDAELRMLRAQINPHFFFNSLNTILAGLERDPQAMTGVVQGLADYLRYSLAHRHTAMVPLGDEFDAVVNYLTVEKARFRDDFEFTAHIDDAARTVQVPGVMLQPLIENAVKHGYKTTAIPLRLRVRVEAGADGTTTIDVANSGHWIEPPPQRASGDPSGVGLESLKRRLALLCAGAHRFDIRSAGGEVIIRIQLFPIAAAS